MSHAIITPGLRGNELSEPTSSEDGGMVAQNRYWPVFSESITWSMCYSSKSFVPEAQRLMAEYKMLHVVRCNAKYVSRVCFFLWIPNGWCFQAAKIWIRFNRSIFVFHVVAFRAIGMTPRSARDDFILLVLARGGKERRAIIRSNITNSIDLKMILWCSDDCECCNVGEDI